MLARRSILISAFLFTFMFSTTLAFSEEGCLDFPNPVIARDKIFTKVCFDDSLRSSYKAYLYYKSDAKGEYMTLVGQCLERYYESFQCFFTSTSMSMDDYLLVNYISPRANEHTDWTLYINGTKVRI